MTNVLNRRILHRLAPSTRAFRVLAAIATVGLFATACDVHGVSGPGTVTTLSITPNPATLAIGATQQFTLVAKDFSGAVITPTSPSWSIAAGGGTISASGLFTAGTVPGAFTNTVTATLDGVSATATVNVVAGPLATITVTPNPATMGIGAAQQFTAVGKDAAGNVLTIVPSWSVIAGGGSINPTSGLFTAGNTAGSFANTVRASVGTIAGTATVNVTAGPLATITVTPNPQTLQTGATQQYTAVGRDAGGNVLTISPAWSVANGGGTIDPTGLFTAGTTTGTFANTVTATSGTISGTATVTVIPVLTSIIVTPNPATVASGTTQQFSAAGRDAANNPIGITPVWAVVNGGGTIDANTGLFTAGTVAGAFTSTVRATSGTVSGFATVTVTVAPVLASIVVTPNPDTVQTNSTQQFSAAGFDNNGNPFPISPVWSVVNGGGSINPATGLFTSGSSTGTFANTVRATSGTVSGSATVVVTPLVLNPNLLGSAAPNGIMAGTAFTCIIGGIINADISISPGSTVTGFPPCVITGVQHLADAVAAQAQIDLTTAYNNLAGRPCSPSNAIVADLGGTTLTAGVYCSGTSIGVTGNLTLDGGGDPNAVFIFQAGTGLTTAGNVLLINGADAKNVYWQVGSSATIGTASQWKGNIVALTSITLVDNANLIGRALARNGAVSLGTNNVVTLP
jgi:hypothetical protein